MRGLTPDGKAQTVTTFATGLKQPFGLAFYPLGANPQWIYIGNTDSVVRFPYRNGDLKARGAAETIVPVLPAHGGHWTRDVVFSKDGTKLFVSVGSASNVDDSDISKHEFQRADVLEFNPDGSGRRVYAAGLRNPVSIALDPRSNELWSSVNERDLLGDNLPPDYVTHVREGGFYGWPYYYIGPNPDVRVHSGTSPVAADQVVIPDVLIQPHSAPLGIAFYTGRQFPAEYSGDLFVALHGSWNRALRTGYKIVRIKVRNGQATGEYQDFVTGFVTPSGEVWGRPVALMVANDGSLLMSDDGSGTIWRIAYAKPAR